MIQVHTERENYTDVTEIVVDEEGCEGLRDFFGALPETSKVVGVVHINVPEDSRPLHVRFESQHDREERLRKAAEEEAQRAAERAAREAERLATEQQRAVADLQRRAAVGPTLPEEDNA